MKQEKQQYLSPQLTVVEFAAERGFAGSGGQSVTVLAMGDPQSGSRFKAGDDRQFGGSIW